MQAQTQRDAGNLGVPDENCPVLSEALQKKGNFLALADAWQEHVGDADIELLKQNLGSNGRDRRSTEPGPSAVALIQAVTDRPVAGQGKVDARKARGSLFDATGQIGVDLPQRSYVVLEELWIQ
jgi:hypothetical protein